MILGAISSTDKKDLRSAVHPDTIKYLLDMGIEVIFESGTGSGISVTDSRFEKIGAKSKTRYDCIRSSDILLSPGKLNNDEIMDMKSNSIFLGLLNPFINKEQFQQFKKRGNTAISMEFIPRITRAQKMDVLSSQSNLAGYVAVIESAKLLNAALPMMMTAAGTLKPANVFVIGVGVAGLQAIATAKRLGAKVEAFDTRPIVEEQVKSLGAKFVKIELGNTGETSQGYAQELTKEQLKLQKNLQADVCKKSDIVITTAQIFGKPAPKLIDSNTIKAMKEGSVVFDMAIETGGNVEGSKIDSIENINGVNIVGFSNLPSYVSSHASFALSNNFINFISDFYDNEKKSFNLNLEDEILQSATVVSAGKILKKEFD